MGVHVPRLIPTIMEYRSNKNFYNELFRKKMKGLDLGCDVDDPNLMHDNLTVLELLPTSMGPWKQNS